MRLAVALLLAILVCPGATEVVEVAVHAMLHGEGPDSGSETRDCEHACTPLRHQCSCHSSMSAQVTLWQARTVARGAVIISPFARSRRPVGRASEPPPLPPPIG